MYTNKLIHETSPYLLQHAHNPVDWHAWDKKLLAEAQKEGKLLLISIGYAACHWCHVMEKECFEDVETATFMNKHFKNIKIDREERPDLDHIYMNALQLMTGRGGWPLNIVALPDGRPVWGATYLPKKQWKSTLLQLADLYQKAPDKIIEYAEKLQAGVQKISAIEPVVSLEEEEFDPHFINAIVAQWSKKFDLENGGSIGAPKFMMPNNLHFLLRYAYTHKDENTLTYVQHSLKQMAYGGIYDHIGGGFARYAVDECWHVPHFEKMLYDNAQLVSLYSDAFLVFKNPLFKAVVEETLAFISSKMTSTEGSFYSSLDADSLSTSNKLEEGAFYCWSKNELQDALNEDFLLFADFFNVNNYGYWEEEKYVLIRKDNLKTLAEKYRLSQKELLQKIETCKTKLFSIREKRNKPALDNKVLTSWNALMLNAFVDAYRVFDKQNYLDAALKNAHFIWNSLRIDKQLYRNRKDKKTTIEAFLDDYALLAKAYINLYETTFGEEWLLKAKEIIAYCLENFFDSKNGMLNYTSKKSETLFANTIETQDNVIPASNSIMAKNLFKISGYFKNENYRAIAKKMLQNMQNEFTAYPSGYSNWLDLYLDFSTPNYQLAICGKEAHKKLKEFNSHYFPQVSLAGSITKNSKLPLIENRWNPDKTLLYLCDFGSCLAPTEELSKLIEDIRFEDRS